MEYDLGYVFPKIFWQLSFEIRETVWNVIEMQYAFVIICIYLYTSYYDVGVS